MTDLETLIQMFTHTGFVLEPEVDGHRFGTRLTVVNRKGVLFVGTWSHKVGSEWGRMRFTFDSEGNLKGTECLPDKDEDTKGQVA